MDIITIKRHVRSGPRGGEYPGFIYCCDVINDIGHYLRKRSTNLLDCPFGCKARLHFDAKTSIATVDTAPDENCRGKIENYRKFEFVSLIRGGRLDQLPAWAEKIQLCLPEEPMAQLIKRVANVSNLLHL